MNDIVITPDVLNLRDVEKFLADDGSGGQVYFVGAVRNATKGKEVIALEFECYEPMAIKEMCKIADDVRKKWAITNIVMHHRVGKLAIGEYPVIIGASSAHRRESFEACQYMIDILKETVPIWKKEIFTNGDIWVSAHP